MYDIVATRDVVSFRGLVAIMRSASLFAVAVLAVMLAGTCVAVLTFLLFFLYDRAISGEVDFYLFRVTVLVVIVPMFLFTYSALYYDRVIRSVSKGGARVISYLRRADGSLMFGLILFAFGPVLILSTIRLMDLLDSIAT